MAALIQRTLLQEVARHLSKKEISLIVGARQVGKTTLMTVLQESLDKRGERTLFLSLDFEEDRRHFVSQGALLRKVELELGKKRGYVFIDEIQRKENAGLFLKGLYDRNLPYKWIVSGSGSLELKEKIHESLTGRKRLFELSPLSFGEFVNFKTGYAYDANLSAFFSTEQEKSEELLTEYLNFGGYPRVVLEETMREKRNIIAEIFRSYLEKDISYLLRVEKADAFSQTVRILADQIGRLIRYSELSSTLGLSLPTVKNYLWYAEMTFVIHRLSPYFRNKRKEITKSPVLYFGDLGLRNYAIGQFGSVSQQSELGYLFENLVFQLLRKKAAEKGYDSHYWRTKDGAEVDFIIVSGKWLIPVEVKYKKMKEPEAGRSLRSFIKKYKPGQAWIVNLELRKQSHISGTRVQFIPIYDLI